MAHRPLCEINVYSQYKTLCCENTMDGKTMFNHHLLWLFLFPWEIPALINHKMKGTGLFLPELKQFFTHSLEKNPHSQVFHSLVITRKAFMQKRCLTQNPHTKPVRVAQNFKYEKFIWDQTDSCFLGSKQYKNAKILKFRKYLDIAKCNQSFTT